MLRVDVIGPLRVGASGGDVALTGDLQRRLLMQAVNLVRPGGTIVFCTCSLEPEEGERLVADVLTEEPRLRRRPIAAGEVAGLDGLLTAEGELRSLPSHWPDPDSRMAGLDGFYAARLERVAEP